jgi:hypothetical protein
MRSNTRRPIVAALAIILGLCLVVCVIVALVRTPARSTTTTPPVRISDPTVTIATVVLSKSIGNNNPCHFEQTYDSPIGIVAARKQVQPVLPTDAQLVRTYNPPAVPELTVDLYNSAWLKDRYTSWPGGDPGDFIVVYGPSSIAVSRIVIACGNQP